MSDFDPNRMPPERPEMRDARHDTDAGFNWNWVIGGIAALVVLLVALSFAGRDSDQTAGTGTTPAATTGQSAPAEKISPRPVTPQTPPAKQ